MRIVVLAILFLVALAGVLVFLRRASSQPAPPTKPLKATVTITSAFTDLAHCVIHNGDTDAIIEKIRTISDLDSMDPIDALSVVSDEVNKYTYGEAVRDDVRLGFALDWKADIEDLVWNLKANLGPMADKVNWPERGQWSEQTGVSYPNLLNTYAKAIADAGFKMVFVDTQADHYFILLTNPEDQRVYKTLEAMGLSWTFSVD